MLFLTYYIIMLLFTILIMVRQTKIKYIFIIKIAKIKKIIY